MVTTHSKGQEVMNKLSTTMNVLKN